MTNQYDKGFLIRKEAEPIANEMVHNIVFYIRYKMNVKVTEADETEFKRITKSIIVQNMEEKK